MDANRFQSEKLNIKNLLFTKAIPNYTLPTPTDGHLTFVCTDCGDRFIIKSSYEYHINRKSMKITYYCRLCNAEKIFFNRCDLLSHIRSHAFKTATISISDLKIEPLPLSFYKFQSQVNNDIETPANPLPCLVNQVNTEVHKSTNDYFCFDCKINISSSGIEYQDRAKHYAEYTNQLYVCPVCLLSLTSQCALKAHLRIHLREPPYVCPDCGIYLTKNAVVYPYSHDCESFKMMRVTAKMQCRVNNCNTVFHPNENNKHLRINHQKPVYKCPICSVACYKMDNMQKHFKVFHEGKLKQSELKKLKHINFVQCEMCPGRLVIPSQIERHLKGHQNSKVNIVYPCWICGVTVSLAKHLLDHHKLNHPDSFKEKMFGKLVPRESNAVYRRNSNFITNNLSRASEKCNKCFRYISKCTANNLQLICKCASETTPKIVCNLCKKSITQDWNIIKKHYAIFHKEHICLDVKILLKKININKYKRTKFLKKPKTINHIENVSCMINGFVTPESRANAILISCDNNKFVCKKCDHDFESKLSLENHMVEHRDPFMAYQCMECGESFIAKPSFSTHLLVKHGVNDVDNYIVQKKCYYKDSLNLQKHNIGDENLPVEENQCNICREQFCNSADFEKHFRVHGMAFLMKNTNKTVSPEKQ